MYITITAQKLSDGFFQSVKDYVDYLEKENEVKELEEFKKILSRIINGIIEEVNPTFGKSYYRLNIDITQLHIMKRRYE